MNLLLGLIYNVKKKRKRKSNETECVKTTTATVDNNGEEMDRTPFNIQSIAPFSVEYEQQKPNNTKKAKM